MMTMIFSLHRAWRRFVPLAQHLGDLLDLAADFRVSAVRVGMAFAAQRTVPTGDSAGRATTDLP